jgi:Flp pilus assembly protein TadD
MSPKHGRKTPKNPVPGGKLEAESGRLSKWWPYLLLGLVVFLVYSQAVGFGFVDFDDTSLAALSRQQIQDRTPLTKILAGDVLGDEYGIFYHRPVLSLSLLADTAIGSGAPWAYHLSNILLHILACCLFLWLLTQAGHKRGPAFLAALVLGVHPALVQAVVWVPGRNDILLAVFLLSSLIALLRYFRGGPWGWLLASSLCHLLALFTKETAAVFLVALPLSALAAGFKPARKKVITSGAILTVTALFWLVARQLILAGRSGGNIPIMEGLHYAGKGFLSYAGKTLLPFNLSLVPDHLDVNIFPGLAAIAALALVFWRWHPARPRWVLSGILWYVLFLLPALPNQTFLEHRLYVPLMGLLFALAGIKPLADLRLSGKKTATVSAALLVLLIFINIGHAKTFRSPDTAWHDAVLTSPNSWLANMSMGLVSSRRGEPALAERYYLRARQLNPVDPKLLTNLGLLYLNDRRPDKAREVFSGLLAAHPDHPGANYNLGQAMDRLKNYEHAAACYRREAHADPANIDARVALGASLAEAGRFGDARESLLWALELDQNNFEALLNMGVIEFRAGNTVKARNWLERAVRAAPERAEGHLNLGHVYRAEKRLPEAQREFGTAAKINPAYRNIKP